MTDLAVAFLAVVAWVAAGIVSGLGLGRIIHFGKGHEFAEGPLAEVRSLEAARRRREKTAPGTLTRPGA